MNVRELFNKTIEYFEQARPSAETELQYSNPYELLVAVILSAQCTDKRVNMTTPALFKEFSSPKALSKATPAKVLPFIKSISYPNNKSKHLVGMAKMLVKDFNGEVPSDVDDLQKLPGVGRKTAHVIASVFFNQPKLAVDTHVFRVADRIGLTTKAKNPLQSEKQLLKYLPENKIAIFHHWIILHGRYVCLARSPKCNECGLSNLCRYYQTSKKKIKSRVKS
jgi:endonuclease-3